MRRNGRVLFSGPFDRHISTSFCIEFIKNNQEVFEETMLLNMGQLLSIPFVIAGVWLVIRALSRPRVPIKFAKEKKK